MDKTKDATKKLKMADKVKLGLLSVLQVNESALYSVRGNNLCRGPFKYLNSYVYA